MGNQINVVAFSPDGALIAGMAGNILNVWNAQTGELRFSQYRRDFNQLLLSFTADGQYIITSNTATEPVLRFWNLEGEEVAIIPLPEGYLSATISPDKSTLITVNSNGIQQWDIQDITAIGEPINITPDDLVIESSYFTAIQAVYSGDGEHLLLRWIDGTLRLFDIDG
jgi:WD40 repeat protein